MTGPGDMTTVTEKAAAIEKAGLKRNPDLVMTGAEDMNASTGETAAEVETGTGRTRRGGTAVEAGTGKDPRRKTRNPGKCHES